MLLAAASIAISFLGRESFGVVHALAWLAVVCFALLSLCVLAILWPSADRNVDVDPQALLAAHLVTGTPDATAISSDLIAHIGVHHRANGRHLEQMSRAFRIGACLLAIQLVLTVLTATVTV